MIWLGIHELKINSRKISLAELNEKCKMKENQGHKICAIDQPCNPDEKHK